MKAFAALFGVILLLLAAAATMAYGAEPVGPALKVSRETTYFTAPLGSDGRVDFAYALSEALRKDTPVQANAALGYWQAVGSEPVPAALRPTFFKLLHMPVPAASNAYFIPAADYFKRKGISVGSDVALSSTLRRLAREPWNSDVEPDFAAWLEANRQPLDLIVAATKHPKFIDPIVLEPGTLLGESKLLSQSRREMVAEALAIRAMNSLSTGKVDDSWNDLVGCYRLAQLISTGPSLADWHLADEIQKIAFDCSGALMSAAFPSVDRAKRFGRDIAAIPRFSEVSQNLDLHSRIEMLQSVSVFEQASLSKLRNFHLAIDEISEPTNLSAPMLDSVGKRVNWNRVAMRINRLMDRIESAHAQPNEDAISAAMEPILEELVVAEERAADVSTLYQALLLNSTDGITRWAGDAVIAKYGPLGSVFRDATTSNARSNLLAIAFTLERYRADHGRYPVELSDLAPFYIPKVANDQYGGEAFRYANQNAGYVLYSIGPNYSDDSGQPPADDGSVEADDIVIRVSGVKACR